MRLESKCTSSLPSCFQRLSGFLVKYPTSVASSLYFFSIILLKNEPSSRSTNAFRRGGRSNVEAWAGIQQCRLSSDLRSENFVKGEGRKEGLGGAVSVILNLFGVSI